MGVWLELKQIELNLKLLFFWVFGSVQFDLKNWLYFENLSSLNSVPIKTETEHQNWIELHLNKKKKNQFCSNLKLIPSIAT